MSIYRRWIIMDSAVVIFQAYIITCKAERNANNDTNG